MTAVPRPVVPSGVCAAGHHCPELLQTRLRTACAFHESPMQTAPGPRKPLCWYSLLATSHIFVLPLPRERSFLFVYCCKTFISNRDNQPGITD